MDNIFVLQVGGKDWSGDCILPDYVVYTYTNSIEQLKRKKYEVVLIGRAITEAEADILFEITRAYCLFVYEDVAIEGPLRSLYRNRAGERISSDSVRDFLTNDLKFFFSGSSGRNHGVLNLGVSPDFKGEMKWNGNHHLTLSGSFGDEYKQVVFWRENLHIHKDQTVELWLEYKKSGDVSIILEAVEFAPSSMTRITNYWKFDEKDLEEVVLLDSSKGKGPVSVSVSAKGKGSLELISLHHRRSRGKYGYYLPGGNRVVTSDREEIFAYLEPGKLQPPLNVYFAGYHTAENFEGYRLMRQLKGPFLLLAENRLEGGGFYMGTPEYESKILEIINEAMEVLGFTKKQVVMSGISMGAFGALYYGAKVDPRAIVLGKPVLSLGDMAAMEKRERPGGFPSSLDLLLKLEGRLDRDTVKSLNYRFWKRFQKAEWTGTKICLEYMCQDEFDHTAYDKILTNLQSASVEVYGKGIQGRHNDATKEISNWFMEQLKYFMSS